MFEKPGVEVKSPLKELGGDFESLHEKLNTFKGKKDYKTLQNEGLAALGDDDDDENDNEDGGVTFTGGQGTPDVKEDL